MRKTKNKEGNFAELPSEETGVVESEPELAAVMVEQSSFYRKCSLSTPKSGEK